MEAIALIMGIDRILDMSRTAVNITGDAVCTVIVANHNKALVKEKYNNIVVRAFSNARTTTLFAFYTVNSSCIRIFITRAIFQSAVI